MQSIGLEDIAISAGRAAGILRAGGVVLYPTDTIYGLGADALSDEAVDMIYHIKQRDEKKPIHAIVASLEMAAEYGDIDPLVHLTVQNLPKGKVTCIVKKKSGLDTGICRDSTSFGFRIPDHALCQALLSAFGKPITATSANIAGKPPHNDVASIFAQLGARAEDIDLVIDSGVSLAPNLMPNASTVVDFTGARPVILREGAVPAADIWDALKQEY
ncbi:MAG TPA: L-threonylcarbamoyladenylate synthase [Candidatus Paceibacterota bacterium]